MQGHHLGQLGVFWEQPKRGREQSAPSTTQVKVLAVHLGMYGEEKWGRKFTPDKATKQWQPKDPPDRERERGYKVEWHSSTSQGSHIFQTVHKSYPEYWVSPFRIPLPHSALAEPAFINLLSLHLHINHTNIVKKSFPMWTIKCKS